MTGIKFIPSERFYTDVKDVELLANNHIINV